MLLFLVFLCFAVREVINKMNLRLNKGKFYFVVVGLAFLVGCDESVTSGSKDIAVQESSEAIQSDTALYLPSGEGLDFGVKPLVDKINDWKGKKYRVLRYQVSADYKEIDRQLSALLSGYGYARAKDVEPKEGALQTSYSRAGAKSIHIRYKRVLKEGFSEDVVVEIWWFLDN